MPEQINDADFRDRPDHIEMPHHQHIERNIPHNGIAFADVVTVSVATFIVCLCIHSSRPYVVYTLNRHFDESLRNYLFRWHQHLWIPIILELIIFPEEHREPGEVGKEGANTFPSNS